MDEVWRKQNSLVSNPEVSKIFLKIIQLMHYSWGKREKGLPLMGVNVANVELPNSKKQFYTIHLEQMLKKGSSCEVDISFVGNLTTNETSGFFKTEYMDARGIKQ